MVFFTRVRRVCSHPLTSSHTPSHLLTPHSSHHNGQRRSLHERDSAQHSALRCHREGGSSGAMTKITPMKNVATTPPPFIDLMKSSIAVQPPSLDGAVGVPRPSI